MDLKSTYNLIAKDWFADHHKDDWWIPGTDKFISYLNQGDLVLDVGCGAGVKSKYLADKGLKVVGIDFSEELLKIARENCSSGDFRLLDLKEAGKLPETFDAIFAQAVLLHIPKKEAVEVIKILSAKLKNKGYFYVAVKEQRPGQAEEQTLKENNYGYDYERFFSYYTMTELKNYFAEINLTVVDAFINKTNQTNWLQIIAKKP